MINDIEEDETLQVAQPLTLSEGQFDYIKDEIYNTIDHCMGNMYSDDLVDTDSAEFSLNGNEIQLDSVDVNTDEITDNIHSAVLEVLDKVVTILKENE